MRPERTMCSNGITEEQKDQKKNREVLDELIDLRFHGITKGR